MVLHGGVPRLSDSLADFNNLEELPVRIRAFWQRDISLGGIVKLIKESYHHIIRHNSCINIGALRFARFNSRSDRPDQTLNPGLRDFAPPCPPNKSVPSYTNQSSSSTNVL